LRGRLRKHSGWLADALEAEGYNVLSAADWKSGLQLFSSHPVDEVIIDYQMPEMMGNDLAAYMKEIKPDVPILLVSGDGSLPGDKLKPVDGFLPKVEPAPVFLAMVKKLLNASQSALSTFSSSQQAMGEARDAEDFPPSSGKPRAA
jgi:CheY-like chemotaxis protein